MKRYLTAVLFLALALPFSACAQWYLFPGGRPAQDSTAVVKADSTAVKAAADSTVAAVQTTVDTTGTAVFADSTGVFTAIDSVAIVVPVTRVALILPLKSTGTPNSNFLDFYCGALLAADELGTEDHRFRLDVFDSTVGLPWPDQLDSCNLVIGPVGPDDLDLMLPRARGKFFVSPLDPKVAPYTELYNVVQAPAGWESQADELIDWLADDLRGGDAVVLLQSAEEAGGEVTSRLAERLSAKEITYSITSTPASWEDMVRGTCRFVIASENDEFCSNAVREIALMNLKGGRNIVYSTSKLRGVADLEVESLHAAAARITASYYADPGNIAVRSFSDRYRKLYKGDPSQWSFQGYDLMTYFGRLAKLFPDNWQEALSDNPWNGLQTDFRFDATGRNNNAVRRLKYNANNTITIIR